MAGGQRARKASGKLLLHAQLVRHAARRESLDRALRKPCCPGDRRVGVKLVLRPPNGADCEDDDLPHTVIERGVRLLAILQIQEGRGDSGLRRTGLNGSMSRSPAVVLWKPEASAQLTMVRVRRS